MTWKRFPHYLLFASGMYPSTVDYEKMHDEICYKLTEIWTSCDSDSVLFVFKVACSGLAWCGISRKICTRFSFALFAVVVSSGPSDSCGVFNNIRHVCFMALIPDTQNCELCIRWECRERFPRHRLQRKTLVIDSGMHHGKHSRHSRRLRKPQFCISAWGP